MNKRWFKNYFNLYKDTIFDDRVHKDLIELKSLLQDTNKKGAKSMILGNGGSAAIT